MSVVSVVVEGEPEDVANFFHALYSNTEAQLHVVSEPVMGVHGETVIPVTNDVVSDKANQEEPKVKRTRKSKTKEEFPPEVAAPMPDPEFDGVSVDGVDKPKNAVEEEIIKQEDKKPITLPEVKEALTQYGIWLTQQGNESSSVKPYLVALMKKYCGGADHTTKILPEYYAPLFEACVSRVPTSELEEYL